MRPVLPYRSFWRPGQLVGVLSRTSTGSWFHSLSEHIPGFGFDFSWGLIWAVKSLIYSNTNLINWSFCWLCACVYRNWALQSLLCPFSYLFRKGRKSTHPKKDGSSNGIFIGWLLCPEMLLGLVSLCEQRWIIQHLWMTNVENTGKDARLIFGAAGCGVTLLSQSERCLREGFNCIFVQ